MLGEGEGALKRMILPFKLGLGGKLGSGKQWFPWIHIEDQINLIFHCFEKTGLSGAINACSPNPVTNSDFTYTLGRVLSRPVFFNMPGVLLPKCQTSISNRKSQVRSWENGICFKTSLEIFWKSPGSESNRKTASHIRDLRCGVNVEMPAIYQNLIFKKMNGISLQRTTQA